MLTKENQNLRNFIEKWSDDYIQQLKLLLLFNEKQQVEWNFEMKQKFIKYFYHARGHFYYFLWYIGNYAEDRRVKKIVLSNLEEEFGYASKSHEQLYLEFAHSFNVDLSKEHIEHKFYHERIKEFNSEHLKWLGQHDNDKRFSAFSAYEKLDNIDYKSLTILAHNIGTSRSSLLFFKVHERVEHFETTEDYLLEIWQRSPEKVREAFEFIASHQLKMWGDLHDIVVKS